jgi:ASCH domain
MDIIRGIVIRQPWVEHILAGRKTWELRGRSCNIRGPVALIEGGTGRIVGVATVAGCQGPLSRTEKSAAAEAGQILVEEVNEEIYTKVYAWILENTLRLPAGIPYKHPSGAVIWVTLDPASRKKLNQATAGYKADGQLTQTQNQGARRR